MRGDRQSFDALMFLCHLASTAQQLLYHSAMIDASRGVSFEVALFFLKWLLEWFLEAITSDLIVHHLGMAAGASIVSFGFPAHSFVLIHVQSIHLPLAINYARRLSGSQRGGVLDVLFGATWLFVVMARGTLIGSESVRMLVAAEPGRYLILSCALTMIALDVQWTRETFDKRRQVSAITAVSFLLGLPLGLASDGQRRGASIAWGTCCVATLLLAGWHGLPALPRALRLRRSNPGSDANTGDAFDCK